MHRGFTKSWRKEFESSVWRMAPIYHRIWYWLRMSANHAKNLIHTPRGYGIYVLPGQKLTSLQNICEAVKYAENRRLIIPDRKTVQKVLKWLEWHNMIVLTCHTTGTLISIVNWETYNNLQKEVATDKASVPGTVNGQGAGKGTGKGAGHKQEGQECNIRIIDGAIYENEEFDEYDYPF